MRQAETREQEAARPHVLVETAATALSASLTKILYPFCIFATFAEASLHAKQSPHGKHCGSAASFAGAASKSVANQLSPIS